MDVQKIKLKGFVKTLRKDKTAVLITHDSKPEGEWFDLMDVIRPEYIKVGTDCEATVTEDLENEETGNRYLSYIKCNAGKSKFNEDEPSRNAYQSGYSSRANEPSENNQANTQAFIFASSVFYGTGKAAEAKQLFEETKEYIEKGSWITRQKA